LARQIAVLGTLEGRNRAAIARLVEQGSVPISALNEWSGGGALARIVRLRSAVQ
jgi:hypothetical protein